jgi:hypothetical protein
LSVEVGGSKKGSQLPWLNSVKCMNPCGPSSGSIYASKDSLDVGREACVSSWNLDRFGSFWIEDRRRFSAVSKAMEERKVKRSTGKV